MARDAKVYTNQGIIAVMQDRERRFVKKTSTGKTIFHTVKVTEYTVNIYSRINVKGTNTTRIYANLLKTELETICDEQETLRLYRVKS